MHHSEDDVVSGTQLAPRRFRLEAWLVGEATAGDHGEGHEDAPIREEEMRPRSARLALLGEPDDRIRGEPDAAGCPQFGREDLVIDAIDEGKRNDRRGNQAATRAEPR